MKCPCSCIRCGRLIELDRLKHAPYCRCDPYGSCANLVCPKCYMELEKQGDGVEEDEQRRMQYQ
jgi:hypothetical protein